MQPPRFGRSKVLRSFRHCVRAQSQGHHTIDRLEERGVERGGLAQRFIIEGREGAVVSQTDVVTGSEATPGKRLKDGVDAHTRFPEGVI